MKKVKPVLRVILVVFCILLISAGIIFCVRIYNDRKYGSAASLTDADVTDLSSYPTDLDGIDVKYVDSGAFQGFHLKADDNRDEKLIPAQNIKGDILVIYGEDDGMMDTEKMADLIRSQNDNVEICGYENAGHMFSGDGIMTEFGMRMRLGGTIEGNEKAMAECTKEMDDFLQAHHSK